MQPDLLTYYSNRAKEYESIYLKPERQNDLAKLAKILQDFFNDDDLLEIACGTGYWTKFLAQKARHILATDFSNEVLEIARSKNLDTEKVTLLKADIYDL